MLCVEPAYSDEVVADLATDNSSVSARPSLSQVPAKVGTDAGLGWGDEREDGDEKDSDKTGELHG